MRTDIPVLLAVDDEPDLEVMLNQKFRRQIRNNELVLLYAPNGKEALKKLDEHSNVSVVLTDINMPEMDGLTLLEEIGKLNRPDLKSVIVSAYGDMSNIRTAMNKGAYDFLTKPIDFSDLDATLNKTLIEVSHLRNAQALKAEFDAVKIDLESATRIQNALIPQKPLADQRLELVGRMLTAKEVGGDFYDYFMIDEDHAGLVIGDVSGKGVQAAIYMAVARTYLRTVAKQVLDPAECLNQVNKLLIPEKSLSSFVTIFYSVINLKTGEFSYSNGGHNLPYIIRKANTVQELEDTDGPIVGKFKLAEFESKKIQMEADDRLFMFTDGVTEAMNINEELFDDAGLQSVLEQWDSKQAIAEQLNSVYEAVSEFSKGYIQTDDITCLLMKLKSPLD